MRKIDVENVSHSVKLTLSGVFNTLSADGNYPVQYGENVQLLTKMQVSGKRKTFSQFFGRFLESNSNYKPFEKKDDDHS